MEVKMNRFGLMTGFRVTPFFNETAALHQQKQLEGKLGYFLLDIDQLTGQEIRIWVCYENYRNDSTFRQPLNDLKAEIERDLEEQDERDQERGRVFRAQLQGLFPTEETEQGNGHNAPNAENGRPSSPAPRPGPQGCRGGAGSVAR